MLRGKNKCISDFNKIYGTMTHLYNILDKRIKDYKNNIKDNLKIKNIFYDIESVYIESVLLNMSILLGLSKNDKTGLSSLEGVLKDLGIKSLCNEIKTFRNENKILFKKIENNRHILIAHIDPIYYEKLKFSKDFIEDCVEKSMLIEKRDLNYDSKKEKLKTIYLENLADNPENERFYLLDFNNNLDSFEKIISETNDFIIRANSEVYLIDKTCKLESNKT